MSTPATGGPRWPLTRVGGSVSTSRSTGTSAATCTSPPIKWALKPGETITLHNPEVAVESEDRAKLLEEMLVIGTPTICVAPGKYKIEFGGVIQSHPKLATPTRELEIKSAEKK